jgi:hypothetical protein
MAMNGEHNVSQKLTLLAIAVLFVGLVGHRVWRAADPPTHGTAPQMPPQVEGIEGRELHLAPRGKYTLADIEANGRTVPSQKYRGFQARHDFNPQMGDSVCPITRTKADPRCTWTVGGQTYSFCCPPCIDEFVKLAKEQPGQVRPPREYVKR